MDNCPPSSSFLRSDSKGSALLLLLPFVTLQEKFEQNEKSGIRDLGHGDKTQLRGAHSERKGVGEINYQEKGQKN